MQIHNHFIRQHSNKSCSKISSMILKLICKDTMRNEIFTWSQRALPQNNYLLTKGKIASLQRKDQADATLRGL